MKTWLGQLFPTFGSDVAGVTGTFSPGLKSFGGPDADDYTILRSRGEFACASSGGSTGDLFLVALGFGLCTTEAAAAGAVPLPFENPEWDGWFNYVVLALQETGSTPNAVSGRVTIDSKAMRKVPSGQVPFFSTQIFTAFSASGATVNEAIQARILVKTS